MEIPGEMVLIGVTSLRELDGEDAVRDRGLVALMEAARVEYARTRNSEELP